MGMQQAVQAARHIHGTKNHGTLQPQQQHPASASVTT